MTVEIDHAAWKRLGSTRDGCGVTGCTDRPAITVTLIGKEGATPLAKFSAGFCPVHAEQRYIAALAALRGATR
jgi:hypothetical protein